MILDNLDNSAKYSKTMSTCTGSSIEARPEKLFEFKKRESEVKENCAKPGLHIVVTITEHACGHLSEGVLKMSTY